MSLPRDVPVDSMAAAVRELAFPFEERVEFVSTVDDQATKGGGWMPWGQKPKKGAAHRERPWGAASMRGAMGTRMRQLPHRDGWGSRFIGKGTGGTETS